MCTHLYQKIYYSVYSDAEMCPLCSALQRCLRQYGLFAPVHFICFILRFYGSSKWPIKMNENTIGSSHSCLLGQWCITLVLRVTSLTVLIEHVEALKSFKSRKQTWWDC